MPRRPSKTDDRNADGTELASASHSNQHTVGRDRNGSTGTSKQPAEFTGGLYVTATPIGNAADITLRALALLTAADAIACEDTRVTQKLLSIHGIHAEKLIAYHEHNAQKALPKLIERLESGEIVALVSDAGTPMINDPGYRLAEACRAQGIPVHALPGASAVTTALVLAGLPTDRFMYCGFPPNKQGQRQRWLEDVAGTRATLVFLESAKRLAASLSDMAEILGPRDACVLREMTKKFEETRSGTLNDLADHFESVGPPKGEITIVVGAPESKAVMSNAEVDELLAEALTSESVKAASAAIADISGRPKRELYQRALAIKSARDNE